MASTLSLTSMSPPGSGENDLVASARAGDDRAFSELYARYQDRIRAFILSKVHDHGRAEDIAQDVFISALRRLRSSEQTIAFKPWIYEIAKNACIDEFRRNRRTPEVSLDADEELVSGRRSLIGIAPTPPAAVEGKMALDDLQGAFGGLSESHHKLLVMREFEGRSYTEIAASTGMSLPMVESALFRARRKLSEEYEELASGRRCEQVQGAIESGRMRSLRSMGIRERRQLTRHLAHCQPCRREARLAGVDDSLVKPRSIAARIAALLPFPLWRWPWGGGTGGSGSGATGTGGSAPGRSLLARTGAHHLSATQSLQTVAGAAGPTGSTVTLGQAAAAVAAIAIAGAGGGAATGLWGSKPAVRPSAVTRVASHSSPDGTAAAHRALMTAAAAAAVRAGHSAGTTRGAHARHSQGTTGLSHSSRHRGGTRVTGSKSAGAKPAGTAGAPVSTRTTGPTRTTATTTGARTTSGSPVTKATGPVSGAPSKVVSKVSGVTHTAGSTVNKVVQSTTGKVLQTTKKVVQGAGSVVQSTGKVLQGAGSVVQGTAGAVLPPKLTQTLGSVVPPLGSGSSGSPPASSATAGSPSAGSVIPPSVDATAKKVTGTVAKTVSGLLP